MDGASPVTCAPRLDWHSGRAAHRARCAAHSPWPSNGLGGIPDEPSVLGPETETGDRPGAAGERGGTRRGGVESFELLRLMQLRARSGQLSSAACGLQGRARTARSADQRRRGWSRDRQPSSAACGLQGARGVHVPRRRAPPRGAAPASSAPRGRRSWLRWGGRSSPAAGRRRRARSADQRCSRLCPRMVTRGGPTDTAVGQGLSSAVVGARRHGRASVVRSLPAPVEPARGPLDRGSTSAQPATAVDGSRRAELAG